MIKLQENDLWKLLKKYRPFIMGLSALMILFFHLWELPEINASFSVRRLVVNNLFFGVDIFLFLSGFGLVYSFSKSKNVAVFYYRRVKRLIIPVIIVGIVTGIINGYNALYILKNIVGINFYLVKPTAFLWFVPAILTLYLFFPLYYSLLKWKNTHYLDTILFTAIILVFWAMATIFLSCRVDVEYFSFINRIPVFLIGICLGNLSTQIEFKITLKRFLLIVLLFAIGVILIYKTSYRGVYLLVPLSGCCVPCCVLAISFTCLVAISLEFLSSIKGISKITDTLIKWLSFCGKMSLEIYCVQEYCLQVIADEKFKEIQFFADNRIIRNILQVFIFFTAGIFLWLVEHYILKLWDYIEKRLFKKEV